MAVQTKSSGTLAPAAQAKETEDFGATPRLKIVVVGHVDHGKSTLIGRIFYDTDALPVGKVEAIQKACELEGMPFEYAFLLDALLEEQEQNITIDTTQIPFQTDARRYVLIDAPGHKEFIKNMVTGAANADAAILVIAANEGVREQSRRHGYLLRLLGVRQIVVAVNKMDLVGYDQTTFERVRDEYTAFLSEIGLTAQRFVPVSAREGDNIARRAADTMPWYDGPSVLETLDGFAAPRPQADLPLRFVLQDVYRFDARRVLAGRIETGTLAIGDTLTFAPGGRTARVATFERWHGPDRDYAVAGESIAITLDEQLFVKRGHVATIVPPTSNGSLSGSPSPAAWAGYPLAGGGQGGEGLLQPGGEGISLSLPQTARRLRANIFWMGPESLLVGEKVRLKLATQETGARIVSIERVIDASTLETVEEARDRLATNDVAEVVIETDAPVVFDSHDTLPTLGRFVLVHHRRVAGGGIVFGEAAGSAATATDRHIVWSDSRVSSDERARRNGHRGAIIWLTGLSGAGKSTVAAAVNRALFEQGYQATLLDGDNLRHGLCADLGFSEADRTENIRRAAHVARLFAESGLVCLTAFISPTLADRAAARAVAEAGNIPFIEVHVSASLETCEGRDPKGLYKKARAGEIRQFTGIDAPYELPTNAELVLDTERLNLEEAAQRLLDTVLEAAETGRL